MVKGYRLLPIQPTTGAMMATACILDDFVTGKVISSMGGGALAISAETYQVLSEDPEVRELIQRKVDALASV